MNCLRVFLVFLTLISSGALSAAEPLSAADRNAMNMLYANALCGHDDWQTAGPFQDVWGKSGEQMRGVWAEFVSRSDRDMDLTFGFGEMTVDASFDAKKKKSFEKLFKLMQNESAHYRILSFDSKHKAYKVTFVADMYGFLLASCHAEVLKIEYTGPATKQDTK